MIFPTDHRPLSCIIQPAIHGAMTIEIVGGAANMIPVTVLAFEVGAPEAADPRRGDIERPGPQRYFKMVESQARFLRRLPSRFPSAPGRGAAPMPW
jgi:hypothetical protein